MSFSSQIKPKQQYLLSNAITCVLVAPLTMGGDALKDMDYLWVINLRLEYNTSLNLVLSMRSSLRANPNFSTSQVGMKGGEKSNQYISSIFQNNYYVGDHNNTGLGSPWVGSRLLLLIFWFTNLSTEVMFLVSSSCNYYNIGIRHTQSPLLIIFCHIFKNVLRLWVLFSAVLVPYHLFPEVFICGFTDILTIILISPLFPW